MGYELIDQAEPEILAIGRLSKAHGENRGEFAILVRDAWQRRGLGSELLARLIEVGRAEKLSAITGQILADNHNMQTLCKKAGFRVWHPTGATDCRAEIRL